jgi:cytochrome c oxidase assembly protein subunit 15
MAGNRKLFEEVAEGQASTAPTGGMIGGGRGRGRGAVRLWLMALFLLVVAMIVLGGLTRLTDSGLSITEWKPVTGAVPPLSESDWAAEFAKYQQIPEYQLQNKGMTLEAFKSIYWWEWGHRQLGRIVGLVWALGFVVFWATRRIPPGWTGRLVLIGALGGVQGGVGWWMVHSGLSGQMLDVASYRLAVHLGLPFAILGLIVWNMFLLARPGAELLQARRGREAGLVTRTSWLAGLAFLQILLGALVAGIDAGRGFTDWPWMAGGVLPPDMFYLEPAWRNFFENAGTVQFTHRMVGYALFLSGGFVWLKGRKSAHRRTRAAFNMMAAMLFLQVVLGIVTVMHSAPLALGLAHQLGAVALWVMIWRARYLSTDPIATSSRGTK